MEDICVGNVGCIQYWEGEVHACRHKHRQQQQEEEEEGYRPVGQRGPVVAETHGGIR